MHYLKVSNSLVFIACSWPNRIEIQLDARSSELDLRSMPMYQSNIYMLPAHQISAMRRIYACKLDIHYLKMLHAFAGRTLILIKSYMYLAGFELNFFGVDII